MTLFKIYKELCVLLNLKCVYKNSEIKSLGEIMPNDIIFYLKDENDIENERDVISKVYFQIIDTIGQDRFNMLIKNIRNILNFKLFKYPDRAITLNTILSIYYIHGYNVHDMYRLTMRFLFKTVEGIKNE